jgi:hypothetical protein
MAKYSVDHTCGHTETHQLVGPHKERDRKIAWLETTLCSECWRAEQERQRAEASAKAAEANQSAGLPDLTGSEKQIAWAESIRRPISDFLGVAETEMLTRFTCSPEARDELAGAIALVVDQVRGQTAAKWWIDAGRGLEIDNQRSALHYLYHQIIDRNLAPLAIAEAEARKAGA